MTADFGMMIVMPDGQTQPITDASKKQEDFAYYHIPFINMLGSYLLKFKAYHWAAVNDAYHRRLDEFYVILDRFMDDIVENMAGANAVIKSDIFSEVSIPEEDDPICTLMQLDKFIQDFYGTINNDVDNESTKNIIVDFMEQIKKYKYLFRLCK